MLRAGTRLRTVACVGLEQAHSHLLCSPECLLLPLRQLVEALQTTQQGLAAEALHSAPGLGDAAALQWQVQPAQGGWGPLQAKHQQQPGAHLHPSLWLAQSLQDVLTRPPLRDVVQAPAESQQAPLALPGGEQALR